MLYKVGHHGSHNATLAGKKTSDVPNLSWIGRGAYANEFTAMITAVRGPGRRRPAVAGHPLPSIKEALVRQGGRARVSDRHRLREDEGSGGAGSTAWKAFQKRASGTALYFDFRMNLKGAPVAHG